MSWLVVHTVRSARPEARELQASQDKPGPNYPDPLTWYYKYGGVCASFDSQAIARSSRLSLAWVYPKWLDAHLVMSALNIQRQKHGVGASWAVVPRPEVTRRHDAVLHYKELLA